MYQPTITSRKNPLVQRARAVRDGKHCELIFVEGVRLCEEAARAEVEIETIFCAEARIKDERVSQLLRSLHGHAEGIIPVSAHVLEAISDTKTTQGIVALARRPATGRDVIEQSVANPLLVIMHGVNNPSNAGAMLRAAEAAGATAAVATRGSADLFSPGALRGSMGSAFRLPLWTGTDFGEAISWCAVRGIKTVATATHAPYVHTGIDWTLPRAVIVGPEAGGLTVDEIAAAGECVRIPMREPVESLNAAVALAVVLYEAARQRGMS
ncbi:MAG: RNA methyltransferase [Acidobacteria bacterium]|nr:RNA methyltransferase [Acidobacteriota bacterium]